MPYIFKDDVGNIIKKIGSDNINPDVELYRFGSATTYTKVSKVEFGELSNRTIGSRKDPTGKRLFLIEVDINTLKEILEEELKLPKYAITLMAPEVANQ